MDKVLSIFPFAIMKFIVQGIKASVATATQCGGSRGQMPFQGRESSVCLGNGK